IIRTKIICQHIVPRRQSYSTLLLLPYETEDKYDILYACIIDNCYFFAGRGGWKNICTDQTSEENRRYHLCFNIEQGKGDRRAWMAAWGNCHNRRHCLRRGLYKEEVGHGRGSVTH